MFVFTSQKAPRNYPLVLKRVKVHNDFRYLGEAIEDILHAFILQGPAVILTDIC